jgi:hypothetical protein
VVQLIDLAIAYSDWMGMAPNQKTAANQPPLLISPEWWPEVVAAHEWDDQDAVADWACSGLTDIHRVGRCPRKDVQNGDDGIEEAASASLVHCGVQG